MDPYHNHKRDIVDAMVEDETINYLSINPRPKYHELIELLSWYWRLPAKLKSGWVFDWIRAIAVDG